MQFAGGEKRIDHGFKNGVELKVIAPVPEDINGKLMCRWFDEKDEDIGKTNNGIRWC